MQTACEEFPRCGEGGITVVAEDRLPEARQSSTHLDCLRRLGRLESPLFTGIVWGQRSADRRLSAFPMLRRVTKTDDGKTNVTFSGSRGSPKAGPTRL